MLKTEASSQIDASSPNIEKAVGVYVCVPIMWIPWHFQCSSGRYRMDDVVLYYQQTGWLVHTGLMT